MVMIPIRCVLAALALALTPVLTVAAPATGVQPAGMVHLAQRAEAVSLEEAAARVRARTGGRILAAETRGRGANRVHRIKVLTKDNRVRIIQVDPQTGEIR